ncbi:class I SAM-dependent methyltransferase [Streptomyces sp. NBC_00400]|uniref:class I SAM-dependent methyltransferase n=1 Tax=Streptomyces sp. NBC_00400 TaxID=2975737 RepID=UPI002E1FD779
MVNVGAGTGSYEPSDAEVTAVDPTPVMLGRHPGPRKVLAGAAQRPFPDGTFDAAMAVLTVHHWHDPRRASRENAEGRTLRTGSGRAPAGNGRYRHAGRHRRNSGVCPRSQVPGSTASPRTDSSGRAVRFHGTRFRSRPRIAPRTGRTTHRARC